MTFEQAIGRVFEFRTHTGDRRRFYVCRRMLNKQYPVVIDLETSTEVPVYGLYISYIPRDWKEILP
jgi:hypothetical protein